MSTPDADPAIFLAEDGAQDPSDPPLRGGDATDASPAPWRTIPNYPFDGGMDLYEVDEEYP